MKKTKTIEDVIKQLALQQTLLEEYRSAFNFLLTNAGGAQKLIQKYKNRRFSVMSVEEFLMLKNILKKLNQQIKLINFIKRYHFDIDDVSLINEEPIKY